MKSFTIYPDKFYTPKVSIGPFNLKDDCSWPEEADFNIIKNLGDNLLFTNSGKEAIRLALEHLKVEKQDTVGIVTTSGNSYVSKCVTETISEYCSWVTNRLTKEMKCLFVIHEFGYLKSKQSMNELRELELPLINDFAYSLLSLAQSKRMDFIQEINLTSLPKSFNINFGGLLNLPKSNVKILNPEVKTKILESLRGQLTHEALVANINQRKKNRDYYVAQLAQHGYQVIWDSSEIVPGVCMITPPENVNLPKLKIFLQRHGIESSVFYGQNAFFVPVHQLMSPKELDYVSYMIGAFKDDH